LADPIQLTLHLLCQGTGGFIKYCGQHMWEGITVLPLPLCAAPQPTLTLSWAPGKADSCSGLQEALPQGKDGLREPIWECTCECQLKALIFLLISTTGPWDSWFPQGCIFGKVYTYHPSHRHSSGMPTHLMAEPKGLQSQCLSTETGNLLQLLP
jgi:hypothetical protein